MMKQLLVTCALVAAVYGAAITTTESVCSAVDAKAKCAMQSFLPEYSEVYGTVTFVHMSPCEEGSMVHVEVNITGLPVNEAQLHGMHIHALGDLTDGCGSTGGHYNPTGSNHGDRTNEPGKRHVGDLGNLQKTDEGEISESFDVGEVQLQGETSVIGRAVVLHIGTDDLGLGGDEGSAKTGNAGGRLACCIIEQDD